MIEFESVGKTFRDGTQAVADLSLVVPSGQITVFVGPSGCGKTTTLRMVNRMIEPTAGRIVWDGAPLKSKRRTTVRRQMGYVIQSGGLFPHRTVLENIGTVPGLLGWDKSKTRSRSKELLDAVGLDRKLGDRYPAQLSGGQQQRVGVARALAADPLVMLMDEPFSAVDPVVRGELHEFFLGLQRELSKTIILITHDIDEAIKLGDQVAILRVGGRLAQVGTPQELLENPTDAFVEGFVGRDRGYRALSFMPASSLGLSSVKVVRDAETAGSADGPVLLVDSDAAPQGWVDPSRGSYALRVGALFDPNVDTLRVALDSALTSPVGLAVAVDRESGRYIGVVSADDILAQVADARAALDAPGGDRPSTAVTGGDQDSAAEAGTDGSTPAHDGGAAAAGVGLAGTTEAPADEPVRDEPVRDEPVGDGHDDAGHPGFGPADSGQTDSGQAEGRTEPAEPVLPEDVAPPQPGEIVLEQSSVEQPVRAAEPPSGADDPTGAEHPVDEHQVDEHPTNELPTDDHPVGDHPVNDESIDQEPTGHQPTGHEQTGDGSIGDERSGATASTSDPVTRPESEAPGPDGPTTR